MITAMINALRALGGAATALLFGAVLGEFLGAACKAIDDALAEFDGEGLADVLRELTPQEEALVSDFASALERWDGR